MGDRLATIDMGREVGGGQLCPFPRRELGPRPTKCGLGRVIPTYQVSSWSIQPFGYNTPLQDRHTDTHTDRQRPDSI